MQDELLENKELQEHLRCLFSNTVDDDITLGKFGLIIFEHLEEHNPIKFMQLKMSGTLLKTVKFQEDEAIKMFIEIQENLLKNDPIPKTDDIFLKTKHLNKIRGIAEEIVISELIIK
ncbi:MAG: TnpV protein [Lachnospirales bacterium]